MEFPKMRRDKQALSLEQCEELLKAGSSGVLALGGGEYPYAVPMSYVWTEGKVYFHAARTGEKLRRLEKEKKVSFCVIGKDDIVPEAYTTHFRSVVVFGTLTVVEDLAERQTAAEALGRKYAPEESEEHLQQELRGSFEAMTVLCLEPVYISGKQARELVKKPLYPHTQKRGLSK